MKVFISSTDKDLREYRQAAIGVVNRLKCIPLAMDLFDAKPQVPIKVCEEEIGECDVFVGIYAHWYGSIPAGETKSFTHLEYELAKKLNKDCLCFIVQEDFPWSNDLYEHDKKTELMTFLEMVKNQQTISLFKGVENFESKFATSLGKIRESKHVAAETGQGKTEEQDFTFMPRPPTPFIAHPYPLPKHFTGRIAERALLSHWLRNEKQPVMVLDAIGGMGKTALACAWLKDDILERGLDITGVFWWSFYDSPFEVFVQKLACYVLGKEDHKESWLSVDIVDLQAVLHKGRFLLVLDGLERILTGYSGMNAGYTRDEGIQSCGNAEIEWEKRQREPVHPQAARFLKHLAAETGNTKTLITTRLMPLPLEGLAGVNSVLLTGLNLEDAAHFLRSEGVIGSRAELEQAAKVYNYHPLMLKLLTSAVKRSRSKDIREADSKGLIDWEEPRKILTTMYNLLTDEERRVAAVISVNRGTFNFELARVLLPDIGENILWQVLMELRDLGFIFYEEKQDSFDFHPILRSFLYDRLTDRKEIHNRAVLYFQALPKPEKVVSLEDLAPVIELYHHLVKAGKCDEAISLYSHRIGKPTYYQLSAYPLIIELLIELLPHGTNGGDHLGGLKKKKDQGWTLNALANTYGLSGQPMKAMPLFLQYINISEKNNEKQSLAVGLGNVASITQIYISQLSAAVVHLRKRIALCREIKDGYVEAWSHLEWARALAFQARVKKKKESSPCSDEELTASIPYWKKKKNYQGLSVYFAYSSLAAGLKGRLTTLLEGHREQGFAQIKEGLYLAQLALKNAEKANSDYRFVTPYRDFVWAYWLLGEAQVQVHCYHSTRQWKPFSVAFYDEYFQRPIETLVIKPGQELSAADRCLSEGLRRCRKANMVMDEPDILLSLARLEEAKISSIPQYKIENSIVAIESLLSEAMEIARRAGYRLNLAGIHLFAGQFLLQNKKHLKEKTTLLGLDAYSHLQKAKEFALDVSEFSDLYQSSDPDFYKDIPEYEMLKRGMTREERIKNGYYVAYRCAELLMKQMNSD